jgi:ABC-type antimicrobial peptide transport system permease subunit
MPIIGVVGDAKNRSLTESARPELYTPGLGTWSLLAFRSEITIVIRARSDAQSLAIPLQRAVAEVAPDVAVYQVMSLGEVVREAGERITTTTLLMSGYAVAAFLVAVAGVYAVLSYLVSQRQHELAIRRALGAPARAILRLVVAESAVVVAWGAIAGALGAYCTSRLLSGLLYGVSSFDPIVTFAVIIVSAIGAIGASVFPALSALRVDPATALRSER